MNGQLCRSSVFLSLSIVIFLTPVTPVVAELPAVGNLTSLGILPSLRIQTPTNFTLPSDIPTVSGSALNDLFSQPSPKPAKKSNSDADLLALILAIKAKEKQDDSQPPPPPPVLPPAADPQPPAAQSVLECVDRWNAAKAQNPDDPNYQNDVFIKYGDCVEVVNGMTPGAGNNPKNEAAVEGIYKGLLCRSADPGGSRYWQDVLATKGPEEVTKNIMNSPEFKDVQAKGGCGCTQPATADSNQAANGGNGDAKQGEGGKKPQANCPKPGQGGNPDSKSGTVASNTDKKD